MSGHTPGPWIYSGGYPAFVAAPAESEWNAAKAKICDLDNRQRKYQRPQDEIDANGRLMAASPDLLKAAKRVRKHLSEILGPHLQEGDREDVFQATQWLQAAIDKAEVNA